MLLIRSLRSLLRFSSIRHSPFSTSAAAVQAERTIREGPRNDWRRDEIKSIYDAPVLDLLFHGVGYSLVSLHDLNLSFHLSLSLSGLSMWLCLCLRVKFTSFFFLSFELISWNGVCLVCFLEWWHACGGNRSRRRKTRFWIWKSKTPFPGSYTGAHLWSMERVCFDLLL